MAEQPQEMNASMNPEELYLEEVFTDRRVGTIQRLTPITAEGSVDETRAVVYSGQTQVLTPGGALPLSFDIPAKTLAEAVDGFGKAAEEAIQDTMRRLQELRREQASSLIVPGSEGAGSVPGGGGIPGGGGLPGGGKIRMP
ncbi:MAG: hypothetical protein P8080_01370 [Gammaproteobacteria bacterium]